MQASTQPSACPLLQLHPTVTMLTCCCRCCAAGQLRHFAAGPGPTVVPNPLQQIVPPILKGIGAAVGGLKGGLAAAADQLTSGPATQGAIAYFADTVRTQRRRCLQVAG